MKFATKDPGALVMTTTIEHPTLGRIRGKTNNGSVQFLGLKYATLENRLAEAKLYHSDARSGEVEATQYGYVN